VVLSIQCFKQKPWLMPNSRNYEQRETQNSHHHHLQEEQEVVILQAWAFAR